MSALPDNVANGKTWNSFREKPQISQSKSVIIFLQVENFIDFKNTNSVNKSDSYN